MSVIGAPALLDLCKRMEFSGVVIDYDAPTVAAAFQAVENVMTSAQVQSALSNAIDAATTPKVLTGAQKIAIVRAWASWKVNN